MAKVRIAILPEVAAAVLVGSAHTCCKCEERGRPTQIHHIDDDPSNNDPANLAVLCLTCHDETQLRGGFARRLSPTDVRLYRDQWVARVAKRRADADALFVARAIGDHHTRTARPTGTATPPKPSREAIDALIGELPDLLREAYAIARPGWDSGINATMKEATYNVIEVVQQMWIELAAAFPDRHFDNLPAQDFIEGLTKQRFAWHYALAEPGGPGTGGTIVGLLAAGGVLSDLESCVVQTVRALKGLGERAAVLRAWRERWDAAKEEK